MHDGEAGPEHDGELSGGCRQRLPSHAPVEAQGAHGEGSQPASRWWSGSAEMSRAIVCPAWRTPVAARRAPSSRRTSSGSVARCDGVVGGDDAAFDERHQRTAHRLHAGADWPTCICE